MKIEALAQMEDALFIIRSAYKAMQEARDKMAMAGLSEREADAYLLGCRQAVIDLFAEDEERKH